MSVKTAELLGTSVQNVINTNSTNEKSQKNKFPDHYKYGKSPDLQSTAYNIFT